MGAGSWGAGSIPAGNDVSTAGIVTPAFNGNEFYALPGRVIILNEDGTVATLDATDQKVAFALGIPLGAIPSSPDVGLDWNAIKRASDARALLTITTEVQRAVAALLRAKAISLGTITMLDVPGTRFFRTPYTNLQLPAPRTRIARVGG